MNESSYLCHSPIRVSYLSSRQLITITVINLISMVGNLTANTLVIHILIKTKQLSNNTSKLLLVLSVSDLLTAIFVQSLFPVVLYELNCIVIAVSIFLAVFFTHVSAYTIALMGIDRYLRIKYYAKFKAIWRRKVVLTLISVAFFLSFFIAVLTEISLILGLEQYVLPIYVAVDGIIVIMIVLFQIKTIRVSNTVLSESTISATERTNKKITKLSKRIMLLLCFFVTPQSITIYISNSNITDQFSYHQKSILEFVTCIGMIFIYVNGFANAVLFLMTNVKAKRFLQGFVR